MKSPEKALFIQLRRIGDILMCTPAVRAFKKKFPGCSLDFLTEHPDVLRGNPHLNSIIEVNPSKQLNPVYQFNLIRKIRKKRYDLVVDFLANPRSAYYSFLTGAETRLSYGYGHRRWAYNLTPPRPATAVYAAFNRLNLLRAIEVFSDDPALEFFPSDRDRTEAGEILKQVPGNRIMTVSPVSRREYRRWPLERFAEICSRLKSEYDFEIVILVGPGEEEFGKRLSEMLTAENPVLPEVDRLGLLGAIFENSLVHIGNDNGPKHIAVACGTPTFSIFGTDNPVSWTYPDSKRHRYIISADIDPECRQSNHKCGPECINKITVNAAYAKMRDLISGLPAINKTLETK
ncbi:MAG: glycosyltransferase family 9 protein [Candidatus Zixiibacteriota bacterium]|nr:MAG: glycosyltransferase family 9 protein [candidate division Zixibacteria bacterium]